MQTNVTDHRKGTDVALIGRSPNPRDSPAARAHAGAKQFAIAAQHATDPHDAAALQQLAKQGAALAAELGGEE